MLTSKYKISSTATLVVLLAILILTSCGKSEPDNTEPTPVPKPTDKIELATGTDPNPVIATDGGTLSVTFNASTSWSAQAVNDRADAWCSVSPTSGNAGAATITITAKPNTEPDDRSASINIKAGTAQQTIKVTQKQKDALTVTASTFEVPAEGNDINIEVKANINVTYKIDRQCSDWIKYVSTKALKTSTLTFAVSKNESLDKREGRIIIGEGALSDTIKIFQAGEAPSIVLNKDEYMAKSEGETFAIEVSSNVDVSFNILHPDGSPIWLEECKTKTMSTNTYWFSAAANGEYDNREAKIIFTDKENNLSDTVKVIQMQKDAIVIGNVEYNFEYTESYFSVNTKSNVEIEISVGSEWIRQIETKGLDEADYLFSVAENESDSLRSSVVIFKSIDGKLSESVRITQQGKPEGPAATQIWYTTTDNDILSGLYEDDFGAQIVSNVYANGRGVLTFDKELKKIASDAFIGSKKRLKSVVFPDNVEEVPMFSYYYYLESVRLPNSAVELPKELFRGCSSLENVKLPRNLKYLPDRIFCFCPSLSDISLPSSLSEIGGYAFYYCENLDSIIIPENVAKLGHGVFYGCTSLKSVDLPDGIISLLSETFKDCSSLEFIDLPESIETFSSSVFSGCSSLKSIDLPEGIKIIYNKVFSGCNSLKSLSLPESVHYIGDNVFSNCTSLKNVSLPKKLTTLGNNVFFYCTSLTSIEIPDYLGELGGFVGCISLTNVSMGENIAIIKPEAFMGCTSLKSIDFPSSVNYISAKAFYGCCNLSEVIFRSQNPPQLEDAVFDGNAADRLIYVSSKYYEKYKKSSCWSPYKSSLVPFSDQTEDDINSYSDGEYTVYMESTKENPMVLIFTGDGYVKEHFKYDGLFDQDMNTAIEGLFAVEPYKSYREYFTVYKLAAYSNDTGISNPSANIVKQTKFGLSLDGWTSRSITCNTDFVFNFVKRIPGIMDETLIKTAICIVSNCGTWAGTANLFSAGESIAFCSRVKDYTVQDYKSIVVHELGGHAIGRLADEYVEYYNERISDYDAEMLRNFQNAWGQSDYYPCYLNVSLYPEQINSPWSHFLGVDGYPKIGMFEGGHYFSYGVWRPTENSCMTSSRLPFNAPSRFYIVKRILEIAGELEPYNFNDSEFVKSEKMQSAMKKFLEKDVKQSNNSTLQTRSWNGVPYDFVPAGGPPVFIHNRQK